MEEMLPEQGQQDRNGNKKSVDLFEDVRDDLQLWYISDITMLKDPSKLIQSVERMNADTYSQKQWKDLLLYILKNE